MPDQRERRGRIDQGPRVVKNPGAPNAEPKWLPDKPRKLEFGKHAPCWACKTKGKKGGNICGACGGTGVIDESPRGNDHS